MAGVVYGSEVKDAMMSHRKRMTLESWGSRWNDEDVDGGNNTRQRFVPASITGRRDHECMNKNGNISKHGCEILNKGYREDAAAVYKLYACQREGFYNKALVLINIFAFCSLAWKEWPIGLFDLLHGKKGQSGCFIIVHSEVGRRAWANC